MPEPGDPMGNDSLEEENIPETGDFLPLNPIDEFKDAVKDAGNREEMLKIARIKVKPLQILRKELMRSRDKAEKNNEIEKADGLEQELTQIESQIFAIEDYANEKVLDKSKQESE